MTGMTTGRPALSAAELRVLREMETRFAEEGSVPPETVGRRGSRTGPDPARLALLLLAASVLIGMAAVIGGAVITLVAAVTVCTASAGVIRRCRRS